MQAVDKYRSMYELRTLHVSPITHFIRIYKHIKRAVESKQGADNSPDSFKQLSHAPQVRKTLSSGRHWPGPLRGTPCRCSALGACRTLSQQTRKLPQEGCTQSESLSTAPGCCASLTAPGDLQPPWTGAAMSRPRGQPKLPDR